MCALLYKSLLFVGRKQQNIVCALLRRNFKLARSYGEKREFWSVLLSAISSDTEVWKSMSGFVVTVVKGIH